MSISLLNTQDLVTPTSEDTRLAHSSANRLARYLEPAPSGPGSGAPIRVSLTDGETTTAELDVPLAAVRLLADILAHMARGESVMLIPMHAELTTQEAADLLNVSRPYLVKLLTEGELPFRRVGSHRRVPARDVIAYKNRTTAEGRAAVAELAGLTDELRDIYPAGPRE